MSNDKMDNYDEETRMNDNIIKLKVDGSTRVVNTIEDQKTARGVSLVCPFPALEVNIPIKFTDAAGDERQGSIHRIGVEDDPETGLPKLRLSVRNAKEERETIVETPSNTLIAEASGLTALPKVVAAETIAEAIEDAMNITNESEEEFESIEVDFSDAESDCVAPPGKATAKLICA